MQLTYLSHSCFLLRTATHRVILDPFLTQNPLAPVAADAVDVDYIVCSHGHDDHTGDALRIAQRCGATIIANHEIAEYFAARGAKTHGMSVGGAWQFPFGRVKLTLAHHSSSDGDPLKPIYLGTACGVLITAEGRTLYHAGDTALFLDMQVIGRAGIDVALVPIGDNYTMGIADAAESLDLLRPKLAVPMHYNTFAQIRQDPADFVNAAAAKGHAVRVLAPGESLEF